MQKPEIKIEIQSLPKVKTLIELLDKYRGSLPTELIGSINALSDCTEFEYTASDIHEIAFSVGCGIDDIQCFIDGKLNNSVSSVNTILKRVSLSTIQAVPSGVSFVANRVYPKHFVVKAGNKVLIEFEQ